jgi:hypothetical protein
VAVVAGIVLVAAGVVALGLSSGDDGGDGGSSAAPEDLDIADLEPALLTADDVGEGFAVDRDDSDDDETSFDDADVAPDCREALDRFEAEDTGDENGIQADFERRSDGVTVSQELSLIEPGEPTIQEIADGLGRCERIAYEDDGQQVELRFGVDEVDGLGDEAIGVDMSFDIELMPGIRVTLEAYGLIVARDGVTSGVMVTGPLNPVTLEFGSVDRHLARDLAERADEKLREVLDG